MSMCAITLESDNSGLATGILNFASKLQCGAGTLLFFPPLSPLPPSILDPLPSNKAQFVDGIQSGLHKILLGTGPNLRMIHINNH